MSASSIRDAETPTLLALSFALPSPWFWLCLAVGPALTGPALFFGFRRLY